MDWNISRIQEHNLRSVWENEERDFTRWLTENIDLLASELGIEIEDARAEEAVGDFSADIVAREMNTGETVVIEVQAQNPRLQSWDTRRKLDWSTNRKSACAWETGS